MPDDLCPEELHPGQVPEQVGGVPVGAGRHPRRRVAVGEHLTETPGLGADVVEVDRVRELGHGGDASQPRLRCASRIRAWGEFHRVPGETPLGRMSACSYGYLYSHAA